MEVGRWDARAQRAEMAWSGWKARGERSGGVIGEGLMEWVGDAVFRRGSLFPVAELLWSCGRGGVVRDR